MSNLVFGFFCLKRCVKILRHSPPKKNTFYRIVNITFVLFCSNKLLQDFIFII
ncbi:hypothetical protein AAJ76_78000366 [Vairimorpha ceranae]|uniref:Uncharacterized protein n=1 Tax=Vairimorpha ceranae TaxID=40302 RepID=A0A0F9WMZ0_9MICR|nr:hypothetical protein AAJ76_78000366 [Vairimorpha ceranae]KKO74373.1 hypothetical protein AAJ76_78000366 [Vairimorpha ceranae]